MLVVNAALFWGIILVIGSLTDYGVSSKLRKFLDHDCLEPEKAANVDTNAFESIDS
jgi:hypothetical protein